MSDSCKRILSPFTGCKKRKAWNNTREKYMPVKRRQNLAETDIGSIYKEEQLEEFFDSESAFYNVNKSDNHDDSYNESNGQQELPEGFANSCYKIVTPILLQKLINDFAVCKHQKQKQPPKVFYEKRCSQRFYKINRKTPVSESLF